MFIGHGLVVFAFAVLIADWRGWDRRPALGLGLVAAAFATIPDIDLLYALFTVDFSVLLGGTEVTPEAFWSAANDVHRSMTHSLLIALIAGPAFGLWASKRSQRGQMEDSAWATADNWLRRRLGQTGHVRRSLIARVTAFGLLAILVTWATIWTGVVGGFVIAVFALAGLAVATLTRRYFDFSPVLVGALAVAGIAIHPWGDLFTGHPPHMLYPLDIVLFPDRIALAGDPTLHLLASFALELGVILFAAVALARLYEFKVRDLVGRRAGLGMGYGIAALVLTPPTITVSYQFVFSILAVGAICGSLRRSQLSLLGTYDLWYRLRGSPRMILERLFTVLVAIALALLSYTAVYLAL